MLLREPLVHFFALGALLFGVHHLLAEPRRITVTAQIRAGLASDHQRRTGMPPTAAEAEALVSAYLDDEVRYREALRLGLDRGDIVVRRRLIQKLDLLAEAEAELPAPGAARSGVGSSASAAAAPETAQLAAYLAAHADRYTVPPRFSLVHVYVSHDPPGTDPAARAADLLRRLRAGAAPTGLGDPFLRGAEFNERSESDLSGLFGPTLAAAIPTLTPGQWSGPLRSSYGLHLVLLRSRTPGGAATLAQVYDEVRRDWERDARQAARRAALAALRARYVE